jgi:cell division protein FtsB
MNYDPNNILNSEETNFVKLSVYQSLEAENARLKAEVERLTELFRKTERLMLLDGEYEATKVGTYDRLQAEVERLTALVESNLNQSKRAMANSDAYVRSLEAQVERLKEAVASSPVAMSRFKELEGKTTFEEINPKEGQP